MTIGAILPHLGAVGGIRRFLELGNVFTRRGIDYTVFSEKGRRCRWFKCDFPIKGWDNIEADYILIGDPPSFGILRRVKGKIFIYVIAAGKYTPGYQEIYGRYPFIVINKLSLKLFPDAYVTEVGVNTEWFRPRNRRVLYYEDQRKFKGSAHIREQLGGLDNIELIGLEYLNNEGIRQAYQHGDYFVAWETRGGGTCNTAAEAVASGLTVVTNGINTEAYADKVIKVDNLREFFTNPMKKFSWERIADKLLEIFRND